MRARRQPTLLIHITLITKRNRMKTMTALLFALALALGAQLALAARSVIISNSSFEIGTYFGANAWYGSSLTNEFGAGWQNNFGSGLANWIGKDDGTGPADNGKRPDKTCVVYLSAYSPNGVTMYHTNVRQPLNFDTTKQYVLQFWHNASSYSKNQSCVFDVTLQGISAAGSESLSGGDFGFTNTAVGGSNPYHYKQIIFTSLWTTAYLRFRNCATTALNNESTYLLLDGICLYQLDRTNDIIVKNPSFEASSYQGPGGGGMGFINQTAGFAPLNDIMAGWTYYDGGYNAASFGTATNSSPFFGGWVPVPEGMNAFMDSKSEFWYGNSLKQTMLKQTINGLTVNQDYCLSYRYQARPGFNNIYSPSNFTVKIGDIEVHRDDLMPWGNEFLSATNSFKADATSMELVFGTSNSVDGASMCLDDVAIWPIPEPLALSALGLGLAVWLAGRRA